MFFKPALLALLPLLALVSASPAPADLETRASVDTSSHCGDWDTVKAGPYSLLLDLWGKGGASSGQQCANLISLNGNTVSWKTTWSWTGGDGVKSFTNIQLDQGINKQLSAIKSMPSTWKWSNQPSGTIVANVAYDLFTASTAGGKNENEIMIWLGVYGAKPLSFNYDAQGNAVPVAKGVSIAGQSWNVFSGSNGANNVFSFLPTGGNIGSFSGDLKAFLIYLAQKQGLSTSQFLTTAQAGTEPTSGSATLTTSSYSLTIN